MPLEPRSRRGSYEIVSLLGRGGMGEVYRARDLKLNRDVAIKFLPDQLSQDSERLGRLRREARVVAALNLPTYAIDIEESLDKLRERAQKDAVTKVEIILSERADPKLPPPLDAVLIRNTITR